MAEDLTALEAEFDKCKKFVPTKPGSTEQLRAINRMIAIKKQVEAELSRLASKMNEDIAEVTGRR